MLGARALGGRLGWWQLGEAFAGYAVIWLVWFASGRRIGLGDAKLSALIAFLLGWWGWLLGLFLASLAGTLFVIVRSGRGALARGPRWRSGFP